MEHDAVVGLAQISSTIAPALTHIEGSYTTIVAGAGGYLFWNDMLYASLIGYKGLPVGALQALGDGNSTTDAITNVAPYWRVALEPHWGSHYLMVGTFGAGAWATGWAGESIASRLSSARSHGAFTATRVRKRKAISFSGRASHARCGAGSGAARLSLGQHLRRAASTSRRGGTTGRRSCRQVASAGRTHLIDVVPPRSIWRL